MLQVPVPTTPLPAEDLDLPTAEPADATSAGDSSRVAAVADDAAPLSSAEQTLNRALETIRSLSEGMKTLKSLGELALASSSAPRESEPGPEPEPVRAVATMPTPPPTTPDLDGAPAALTPDATAATAFTAANSAAGRAVETPSETCREPSTALLAGSMPATCAVRPVAAAEAAMLAASEPEPTSEAVAASEPVAPNEPAGAVVSAEAPAVPNVIETVTAVEGVVGAAAEALVDATSATPIVTPAGAPPTDASPDSPGAMTANPQAEATVDAAAALAAPSPAEVASPAGSAAPLAADPLTPDPLAPASFDAAAGATSPSAESASLPVSPDPMTESWGTVPLMLQPEQTEKLVSMVGELKELAGGLEALTDQAKVLTQRGDAAERLIASVKSMRRASSLFEFKSLNSLLDLTASLARSLMDQPAGTIEESILRLKAMANLIGQHLSGLEVCMDTNWPLGVLTERVRRLSMGLPLHPGYADWHRGEVDRVLEVDRVTEGVDPLPDVPDDLASAIAASKAQRSASAGAAGASASSGLPDAAAGEARARSAASVRIEGQTIDALLDTVGQLVQGKNRLVAVSHSLRASVETAAAERRASKAPGAGDAGGVEGLDGLASTVDEIDRLTASLQLAVMRIRLVPFAQLVTRYTRVVTDVANLADRRAELVVDGGETLVEKGAFDALAEPLQQVLKFASSKSIEPPAERTAAGKPETGRVRFCAENQGSQVVLTIDDDGKGLDRDALATDLVQRNAVDADSIDAMTDSALFSLLAADVLPDHPLAGLANSVASALGGAVRLDRSTRGGFCAVISIPTNSAIIAAVLVYAGAGVYAIPLARVTEIVKPETAQLSSIRGRACLRLRDRVMPVIDLRLTLGETQPCKEAGKGGPVAVIVHVDGKTAAVLVDGIKGKHEIVMKPLAGDLAGQGPFSGATIGDDGKVSLIVDPSKLLSDESAVALFDSLETPATPATPVTPMKPGTTSVATPPTGPSATSSPAVPAVAAQPAGGQTRATARAA